MSSACTHLDQIADVTPSSHGCEDCLRIGGEWVHLRMCMTCGHVGCCDNSPNRHATAHFKAEHHPIIQSYEPGEDWWWCYIDVLAFELDNAPSFAHPVTIRRFLDAQDRRDTDAALAQFSAAAHVRDDGHDYAGLEEIRAWLSGASVAFHYTRTLIDMTATGPGAWLVRNHLEGNFPGGQVDLRYQFQLHGDRIAELVIEP